MKDFASTIFNAVYKHAVDKYEYNELNPESYVNFRILIFSAFMPYIDLLYTIGITYCCLLCKYSIIEFKQRFFRLSSQRLNEFKYNLQVLIIFLEHSLKLSDDVSSL